MDPIHLGLVSSLHIHASGALTFCGAGEEPDFFDDVALLALEA